MEEEEWVGEVERRLGGWEVGWEVGWADGMVVGAEEVSGAWVWVNPLLGDEGGWVGVGWGTLNVGVCVGSSEMKRCCFCVAQAANRPVWPRAIR